MPSGGGMGCPMSGGGVVPVFMPLPSGLLVPPGWPVPPGLSVMSPGVVSELVEPEAAGFIELFAGCAGSLGLDPDGFACWLLLELFVGLPKGPPP